MKIESPRGFLQCILSILHLIPIQTTFADPYEEDSVDDIAPLTSEEESKSDEEQKPVTFHYTIL